MTIKIFVDQGHNPVNPNAGAEGFGYREQDIVYEVGTRLARLLNEDPNFEARVSRPTPTTQLGTSNTTSLQARVDMANDWGANYFISVHANASLNPAVSGSEAYVYRLDSVAASLGNNMLIGLNNATGLTKRGVFEAPTFYVLRRTYMPAVLMEIGYISNAFDAEFMATDPESFARGMYLGIREYFGL